MFPLKALVHEDIERKTFNMYVADCLGTVMRSFGNKELPLYSEMLEKPYKKELSPQDIVEHVKNLFM